MSSPHQWECPHRLALSHKQQTEGGGGICSLSAGVVGRALPNRLTGRQAGRRGGGEGRGANPQGQPPVRLPNKSQPSSGTQDGERGRLGCKLWEEEK